jgi:hypothetical protein
MRKVFLFTMVFAVGVCAWAYGGEFTYEVGQVWTYDHEGPQPWGTKDATGVRTCTVLRKAKVGDKDCWVIEDRYEQGERPIEEFVGPDHSVIRQILHGGESNDLAEFEPPLEDPLFSLEMGQEKQAECQVVFHGLADGQETNRFRFTRTMKRLPDESVTVPAGTFADCKRISDRIVLHLEHEGTSFDVVAVRQAWWDSQKGLVKEEFVVEPLKGPDGTLYAPERKSKSILKSLTILPSASEPRPW